MYGEWDAVRDAEEERFDADVELGERCAECGLRFHEDQDSMRWFCECPKEGDDD